MALMSRSRSAWALVLTSVAFFMGALDSLVVITALPAVHKEIGGSLSSLEWTVNAYTVAVAAGIISAGHARALVALEGQGAQEHGLKVVIARHLSVRQAENWVRTYRPRRKQRVDSTAELRAIGAGIESKLGLPMKLTGSLNRGKIELRYSSREELERVCAKLLS